MAANPRFTSARRCGRPSASAKAGQPGRSIGSGEIMIAIVAILLFIVAIAALNAFEFGRID